jgi:hypothetical protein
MQRILTRGSFQALLETQKGLCVIPSMIYTTVALQPMYHIVHCRHPLLKTMPESDSHCHGICEQVYIIPMPESVSGVGISYEYTNVRDRWQLLTSLSWYM